MVKITGSGLKKDGKISQSPRQTFDRPSKSRSIVNHGHFKGRIKKLALPVADYKRMREYALSIWHSTYWCIRLKSKTPPHHTSTVCYSCSSDSLTNRGALYGLESVPPVTVNPSIHPPTPRAVWTSHSDTKASVFPEHMNTGGWRRPGRVTAWFRKSRRTCWQSINTLKNVMKASSMLRQV